MPRLSPMFNWELTVATYIQKGIFYLLYDSILPLHTVDSSHLRFHFHTYMTKNFSPRTTIIIIESSSFVGWSVSSVVFPSLSSTSSPLSRLSLCIYFIFFYLRFSWWSSVNRLKDRGWYHSRSSNKINIKKLKDARSVYSCINCPVLFFLWHFIYYQLSSICIDRKLLYLIVLTLLCCWCATATSIDYQ